MYSVRSQISCCIDSPEISKDTSKKTSWLLNILLQNNTMIKSEPTTFQGLPLLHFRNSPKSTILSFFPFRKISCHFEGQSPARFRYSPAQRRVNSPVNYLVYWVCQAPAYTTLQASSSRIDVPWYTRSF